MGNSIINNPDLSQEEKFSRLRYELIEMGIDSFIMGGPVCLTICNGKKYVVTAYNKKFTSDEEFFDHIKDAIKVGLYAVNDMPDDIGGYKLRFGQITKEPPVNV